MKKSKGFLIQIETESGATINWWADTKRASEFICVCGCGQQAVAFWPVSFFFIARPYARECLDKIKQRVMIACFKIHEKYNPPAANGSCGSVYRSLRPHGSKSASAPPKPVVYEYCGRRARPNKEWVGRLCVRLTRVSKKPKNCKVRFLDNSEEAVVNIGNLRIKKEAKDGI